MAGVTIHDGVTIDGMTAADWPAVRVVYEAGIATGQATFETAAPAWEAWDAGHLPVGRLCARVGGAVVGWAALAPVSRRAVYAGVVEVSVYVRPDWHGRGVGSGLLAALVAASERAGLWTLQAGIFPENAASLALHTKHGFRVVGRRQRIGRLGGVWRDTVLLERRSSIVG
ncbi:MAG TPA: GNAT family N-acetyltransferase [Gemmataceae bacterium]|jgi:phosphinothricin acetyltransferase